MDKTSELSEPEQEIYYSSHLYGLLHVLASIPKLKTREKLISASGLPASIVNEAIDFLLNNGVLIMADGKLQAGVAHLHLGRNSKLIRQHHTNWRHASIQRLSFPDPQDLHYSLTFTCSENDANEIRESLLQHLQQMTKKIEKSSEDKAYVYCLDFFEWK